MKEITDKLAYELLSDMEKMEEYAAEEFVKAKKRGDKEAKIAWGMVSCMMFGNRVHLAYHMEDMIEHPDYKEAAA